MTEKIRRIYRHHGIQCKWCNTVGTPDGYQLHGITVCPWCAKHVMKWDLNQPIEDSEETARRTR